MDILKTSKIFINTFQVNLVITLVCVFVITVYSSSFAEEVRIIGGSGLKSIELNASPLSHKEKLVNEHTQSRQINNPQKLTKTINLNDLYRPDRKQHRNSDQNSQSTYAPLPPKTIVRDKSKLEDDQTIIKEVAKDTQSSDSTITQTIITQNKNNKKQDPVQLLTENKSNKKIDETDIIDIGDKLVMEFQSGKAELSDEHTDLLDDIAKVMSVDKSKRIQLKSYAQGNTDSESNARRLSLSRALSVRAALIEIGIRSTRIDVRALGSQNSGATPDRVDIFILER